MSRCGRLPLCSLLRQHPHFSAVRLMDICWLGSSNPHHGHLVDNSPLFVFGPLVTYSILLASNRAIQSILALRFLNCFSYNIQPLTIANWVLLLK